MPKWNKEDGKGNMSGKLIIDGNSVYEVDEECLKRKRIPRECKIKEALERNAAREAEREKNYRNKMLP